jgi:hypothetical protein
MNGWQLTRQIRYLLRERRWEGAPANEHVFRSNSVRITPIDIESFLGTANPGSPACTINLGRRTSDQQTKGYVAQEVVVTLAVQVEGDEVKENAAIGANRTAGKGSSKGRGLAEVESELMSVLDDVTAMQGFQVQGYSAGSVEEAQVSSTLAFVYCEHTFMFMCTSQLTWLGPTSLNGSGATGGSISLAWTPAPLSWASIPGVGGQIIKYAAGSTPPATPIDGLPGPTVSGIAGSAVISPLASGDYAISIFTMYKESGAAVASDRNSPPTSILLSVP